jgi:hypothetical protein
MMAFWDYDDLSNRTCSGIISKNIIAVPFGTYKQNFDKIEKAIVLSET